MYVQRPGVLFQFYIMIILISNPISRRENTAILNVVTTLVLQLVYEYGKNSNLHWDEKIHVIFLKARNVGMKHLNR